MAPLSGADRGELDERPDAVVRARRLPVPQAARGPVAGFARSLSPWVELATLAVKRAGRG